MFFKVLVAVAVPILIWLGVMAEEIITAVLGSQWLPALPIVAILAASRAMMLPGFATEAILSLAGEIKRLPWFALLFLALTVIAALATAPFGILAVAWGQVGVAFVIAVATFWMFQAYGGINWREMLYSWRTILIPIATGTIVLLLLRDSALFAGMSPLARAFGAGIPTMLVYAVMLALIDPQIRDLVRARIARRKAGA